ncbi:MAG: hypothetical protein VX223_01570 [Myxococcota bacterium]|nr:hypothetical protein [Myxococcota bacterium]
MKDISFATFAAALMVSLIAPSALANNPPSDSQSETTDTPPAESADESRVPETDEATEPNTDEATGPNTDEERDPDGVEAQYEIPKHRIKYSSLTVLRYNPLGLQSLFDLQYQYKLYDSDSILFRTGYFGIGVMPIVSPGLVRLGVKTEIEPIAVLRLGAKWEYIVHFSNFNLMQSYEDVGVADFSEAGLEAGGEAGENYAGTGWQATLEAQVRAKFGPIVVRSTFKGIYTDMNLRGNDTVWYDQYYDILTPGSAGWVLINDADLLAFLLDDKLIVGLRHNTTHAIYPDRAYGSASTSARNTADTPIQRIGPLFAYRFFDEPGAAFNQPTLLVILNWYIHHPYRIGQETTRAVPYVVVGFAFNGDLL